jgi:hypothetical protein
MKLYIQVDDDQADRIFVDLLLNCYWEYTGELAFAEEAGEIARACKTLLKQYMTPSEYGVEVEE